MGLSANAFLNVLLSAYGQLENDKSVLNNENLSNAQEVSGQESDLRGVKSQLTTETNTLKGYQQELLKILDTENPLNKIYCGIKEFVIENSGMCGMGMGMGHMENNCSIKLTGKELLAMNSVLNGNSDGRYSPEDLVEQLKSMGIENSQVSEDGKSIELTRSDGSKVKFCDANGDGMLNGCDYDFTDALAKFNQDMDAFNAKVDEMKAKIEEQETKVDELDGQKDGIENTLRQLGKEGEKIQKEIEQNDKDIKEIESEIAQTKDEMEENLKAEKEKQDAEKAAEVESSTAEETKASTDDDADDENLTVKEDLNGDGKIDKDDQKIFDERQEPQNGT